MYHSRPSTPEKEVRKTCMYCNKVEVIINREPVYSQSAGKIVNRYVCRRMDNNEIHNCLKNGY